MTASRYCKSVNWLPPALLLMLPLPLSAQDSIPSWINDIQLHGFASQGFIKTDHNNFFGDSENGSFEFTELAINASARPLPSLLVSGQLLSRNAGAMDDASPQVDYVLADWTFAQGSSYSAGVALGRQKNPIGLYNETRDVASTRPGIFVPQSVYFDKVRDLVLASDGIGLHGDWYTDQGLLHVKAQYGYMQVDTNVEYAYLGGDFPGKMEPNGPSWLGRIGYEDESGIWQVAASGVYSEMQYKASTGSPLQNGRTDFYYWVLSAQLNGDDWGLTGEYAWEPIDWYGYGPALPDRELTGTGWYIQGDYNVRPDLSLLLRYESALADKDDPDGTATSAASGGVIPPFAMYSHNWVSGLRWDITPQWMLRFEYQRNTGTHVLSARENPNPAKLQKHWQLFSVLASYRF